MVRMAALRLTSTSRVWALLHHTGAQYSAGAYTSARVDVLNVGVLAPQLVPARRRINDFASERSQVVTVCQCSVKLHAKVRRCSLAGQSSTTDVYVKFTFCLSVVQVKRCRYCFGFT